MVLSSALNAVLASRAAANPDKTIRKARASAYPHQLWWLIASFIGFIAIIHFGSWAAEKYSARQRPAQRPASTRRVSWRRIPLALVNAYRVVAFRWTVKFGPWRTLTLAEVFITCAYIVALYTWAFVNTTSLTGDKLNVSYWDNRAGVLGASQLPLVVALGTKNNVLSYITGISYDKLKYIHRMIARTVFVLLWTHGITRLVVLSDPGQYPNWFIPLGIVAMSAFTILILVSLRPIREKVYELFYYVHVLTVLIILLAAYFHAADMMFGFYIWPCFIIWGLDRATRLVRLIYYNHLYFGFSAASNRLDASVELLSPHLVRLRMKRPPHFRWTPGQEAYLAMPTVSKLIVESHPFTIASVDARYALVGTQPHDVEKNASESGSDDGTTSYWNELVFLIHVREGYTRRLAKSATKGERVKVLIDGPYGFSPNLDADDTVILIAGGSGVSYTLSTFLGVLSNVQTGKSKCRKVVFIWAIREASHMDWVSKTLAKALELAPSELEVFIRISVTARNDQNHVLALNDNESVHSSEGTDPSKSRPSSLLNLPAVQVAQGRPDLPALLREEVATNAGRMSVTVCGSHGIAEACRKALRIPMSVTLEGGPSVVLHVESFGFA
ncbi:iron reductase [Cubamyces lactineus]|nr:iron reductase [Cubamyces lactineus]